MTTWGFAWFVVGLVAGVSVTLAVLAVWVMYHEWKLTQLREEDERAEEGIRFEIVDNEYQIREGLRRGPHVREGLRRGPHVREGLRRGPHEHRGDREDCEIEHGEAPKKRGQL